MNAHTRAEENAQTIKANPALVARSFRFDSERKCWLAKSWTSDAEYEIRWAVSGTILLTNCQCPGASRGHLCRHQSSWAALILPEHYKTVPITEHRTAGNASIGLKKAQPRKRQEAY